MQCRICFLPIGTKKRKKKPQYRICLFLYLTAFSIPLIINRVLITFHKIYNELPWYNELIMLITNHKQLV